MSNKNITKYLKIDAKWSSIGDTSKGPCNRTAHPVAHLWQDPCMPGICQPPTMSEFFWYQCLPTSSPYLLRGGDWTLWTDFTLKTPAADRVQDNYNSHYNFTGYCGNEMRTAQFYTGPRHVVFTGHQICNPLKDSSSQYWCIAPVISGCLSLQTAGWVQLSNKFQPLNCPPEPGVMLKIGLLMFWESPLPCLFLQWARLSYRCGPVTSWRSPWRR